ncbi:damage-control phosphatase ARMT1 family protein [Fusibacter bizertensis]
MKISRECIHCLARQAVEIAEEATPLKEEQEEIIKRSLKSLSELDFDATAPEIAYKMHQHAKQITGNRDPYEKLKMEYNTIATEITEIIKSEKWLENAHNPFDMACRLAIAGNIIDFSVGLELDYSAILKSVEDSLKIELFGSGTHALNEAIQTSNRIMYLADNAGEIMFDKFLLNYLPKEKVIYVVKGAPIVNDATMDDVYFSGIHNLVQVMDNGHSAQGTILSACSEAFLAAFEKCDLIISKGQANFETLSHISNKKIFYLLRAKCKSVAAEIGCKRMDYVLSEVNF